MPITVEWANAEQTVVMQRFIERWTWDEFYSACTEDTAGLIKTVPHTVHIFSDFTKSDGVPIGGAVLHARNVMSQYPPNWGTLTIVGASHLINLLVDMFRKSFSTSLGRRTFIAATIEAAYEQLPQYPTAPEIKNQ